MFNLDVDSFTLLPTPNFTGSPERRLLLAILERAILDYVGNDRREMRAAEEWIFSETDDRDGDFSFSWVCRQLDLEPGFVSSTIRAMPKRGKSRLAPWYTCKESTAKRRSTRDALRVC